ncbi:histidine kinase [Nocardiopsis sp. RSe5-2]|uniref:Histidine kinase n=1 Tax=Nocardiopsis endophytica TaxID=3018445 RepID=A0ABT4UDJ8_9ACTN|nr:histidine kinase [Nocardiopsis endophytica]MDA2815038.1 histidine kinase [Nocardiopsis endophytica]
MGRSPEPGTAPGEGTAGRMASGSGAPGTPGETADDPRWRTARWIVFGALAFLALTIALFSVQTVLTVGDAIAPWRRVAALVLSVPLAALSIRMVWRRVNGATSTSGLFWASVLLLAAEVAALDMWVGTALVAGVWWSAAGVANSAARMAAPTALLLAAPWVRAVFFDPADWGLVALLVVAGAVWAVLMYVGHLGLLFLWDLAGAAAAGTRARARLAVSEERLRFARDMHDLLGHRLTGIAVGSELAARLAERAPDQAVDQMRRVREATGEALREMHGAVSGYRDVELARELDGLRAVLASTGAHLTVEGAPEDVPEAVRPPAAWVVREGGTNVVRHSRAENCGVVLRREEGRVVVEVTNDGVGDGAGDGADGWAGDGAGDGAETGGEGGADPGRGNGLTGLAERVAAVGGTLEARRSGRDGFLLRAVLPVGPPAGADGGARERAPKGAGT